MRDIYVSRKSGRLPDFCVGFRLTRLHDAVIRVYDECRRRKCRRKRLPWSMPNESKAPEEYLSDALDLMVKAKWIKQYGPSAKGFEVDWTDRGKLAMEALGYVIEDLGPENFNQQLWWAVGTLANMEFTSRRQQTESAPRLYREPMEEE